MERSCLFKFLPRLPQEALSKAMTSCGIEKMDSNAAGKSSLSCTVKDGVLTIGQTEAQLYQKGNQAKVPDVVFYDTDQVF